ncbi:MAG: hypothetical protein KGV48_001375 [Alcaligenaceae bacterium]|nr:hypothetical protein [Alcaligenaceae bacterium]
MKTTFYARLLKAFLRHQDQAAEIAYDEHALFSKIQLGLEAEYQAIAEEHDIQEASVRSHRGRWFFSTGMAASVLVGSVLAYNMLMPQTEVQMQGDENLLSALPIVSTSTLAEASQLPVRQNMMNVSLNRQVASHRSYKRSRLNRLSNSYDVPTVAVSHTDTAKKDYLSQMRPVLFNTRGGHVTPYSSSQFERPMGVDMQYIRYTPSQH